VILQIKTSDTEAIKATPSWR